MKKLLIAAAVSAFASASWANDVPALGSVLGGLTGEEMSSFEESLVGAANLNSDIEMAFSAEALDLAIEQGIISQEDAQDVGKALEIIESNADYFDFDLSAVAFDALESGDITLDQLGEMLAVFDQLSDAGKAIVGQEDFELTPEIEAQLSPEDLALIQSVEE